jgi:hypothetical protein
MIDVNYDELFLIRRNKLKLIQRNGQLTQNIVLKGAK